jgi:hypothetical protein
MSVGPGGLHGVGPDPRELGQLKCLGCEWFFGVFVQIPHDVHLAAAARAGTAPAEFLERNVGLAAVVPFDGEFRSDRLNVHRLHDPNLDGSFWKSIVTIEWLRAAGRGAKGWNRHRVQTGVQSVP